MLLSFHSARQPDRIMLMVVFYLNTQNSNKLSFYWFFISINAQVKKEKIYPKNLETHLPLLKILPLRHRLVLTLVTDLIMFICISQVILLSWNHSINWITVALLTFVSPPASEPPPQRPHRGPRPPRCPGHGTLRLATKSAPPHSHASSCTFPVSRPCRHHTAPAGDLCGK